MLFQQLFFDDYCSLINTQYPLRECLLSIVYKCVFLLFSFFDYGMVLQKLKKNSDHTRVDLVFVAD